MTTPAIEINNLSLRFADGTQLFKDLTFSIEAGSCTCILGPSGCGKSTLLRLVSGAKGFTVNGSVSFVPETIHPPRCAWMGQDDLLLPWLNLIDNVLLGLKLRGELSERHRRKAMDLIAEAGLSGREKMLPGALSGGMRQRGALLRTLMEERQILLMDEPFSALDALTRMKLQNLSSRLTGGKTVLLVTHDAIEALRLADVIIVLGGTPASVQMIMKLNGPVPRPPDDQEVARNYAPLLSKLLEDNGL